jgi:streptogramin lyase
MSIQRNILVLVAATAAVALTGCGISSSYNVGTTTSAPVVAAHGVISGTVYGGQQPIGGSTIQLYAAGTSNYGVGATYATGTSLLGTNTVTTATDGTGSFKLAGSYTCPASNPNVYIVATGGSPSTSAGGTVNNQIALMAALGPCMAAQSGNTKVTLNELTTVASVYALSPFMTGIANIGTSASNTTGLNNAFAAVNKIVNISTGVAGGPALPANATLPVAKINTLGNIVAACVNSTGGKVTNGVSDGSACGYLFQYTTVNGTAPTDTITALMNLVQHPNPQYTAQLTNVPTGSAPFQPSLSAAPSDYSLVITYSGGGLSTPKGIAVDNAGNVWTANAGNNSVSEFSNAGAPLSGTNGYTVGSLNAPSAIAIDVNGNAWVANSGNSTVSELNPTGTTGTVFTGGSMSSPSSLAIDGSSNVWVANSGNASVTEISSAGALSNYTGAGITSPTAIAINPK